TLKGIDRAIGILYRTARRSARRDYEVWIFSDHGQIRARPFSREVPGGLEGLVRRHLPASTPNDRPNAPPRAHERGSPASWLGGPRRDRRAARAAEYARLSVFEREVFAIAAMGPVGQIYLARPP